MGNDRKAFNFYKSYYEIAKELSDKDRLAFYDAMMNKQFYGIDPSLKGLANFAWVSQKHSIDAQCVGWERKTKAILQLPDNQGWQGGSVWGSVQEKEKGEEKEKEEYIYNTNIQFIIDEIKYLFDKKYITKSLYPMFDKLLEQYSKEDLIDAIVWAKNDSFWGSNFLSPKKLQTKNRDGVMYADYFISKMKYSKPQKIEPKTKSTAGLFDLPPLN